MLQETVFTEPKEDDLEQKEKDVFNWQCISFIRKTGTSLDLTVKDQSDMMVLINVVQSMLYMPANQGRLDFYKVLRTRMKIGYDSWRKHIKPANLFLQAILKTLSQKVTLIIFKIQKSLPRRITKIGLKKLMQDIKDGLGNMISNMYNYPKIFISQL